MAVDADSFRAVLGQWPSGVTVVTTLADGVPHGMTASSFTSVSLDPPLVSVAIARHVHSHDLIRDAGIFAVSILGKDQVDHGKRFAGMLDLEDRFTGLEVTAAGTGAPIIPGALGWLDCRVWAAYDGGDHTIFVGEVVAAAAHPGTAPLLYHARNWGQVADVLPSRATLTLLDAAAALDAPARGRVSVPADHLPLGSADHGHVIAIAGGTGDIERAKVQGAKAIEVVDGAGTPARLVRLAHDLALPVRYVLPAVFGAADRPRTVDDIVADAQRALALGPDEIVLDDTGNGADPVLVRETLQRLGPLTSPRPVALRVANGPMALAIVLTGLKSGVDHLDVALADPAYVPAADVVTMLQRMGLDAGVAIEQLRALPVTA